MSADLAPWQRQMLEAMFDPGFRGFLSPRARRHGLSTVHRVAVQVHASNGSHVHAAQRDGEWCVTRQQIGFLYARVGR